MSSASSKMMLGRRGAALAGAMALPSKTAPIIQATGTRRIIDRSWVLEPGKNIHRVVLTLRQCRRAGHYKPATRDAQFARNTIFPEPPLLGSNLNHIPTIS